MSPINPGKLRHRISILYKDTGARDADGYPVEEWRELFKTWASFEAISGREYFAAAAVQAEQQVRFTMRYRAEITTDKRILFDGKEYDIKAVIDKDGRKEYLQVMAEIHNNG